MDEVIEVGIDESGNYIEVRSPYDFKDYISLIPSAHWRRGGPAERAWVLPATFAAVGQLEYHMVDFMGGQEGIARSRDYKNLRGLWLKSVEARSYRDRDELPDIPNLTTEAWLHQRQAYWFALEQQATMLAMGMATGKSLVAIGLIAAQVARRALIVCPRSVIIEWPKQFERHAWPSQHTLCLLNKDVGTVAERTEFARKSLDANVSTTVVVINYEAAWREPFASFAKEAEFEMVVLDEIHRIKAPDGKTSNYFAELGEVVPLRLGLTGTPMPHSPLDVYGQFRFLDPAVFGTNHFQFMERYAIMGGYHDREVVAYRNKSVLSKRYNTLTYAIDTEDAVDLPPEHDVDRKVWLIGSAPYYREVQKRFKQAKQEGRLDTEPGLILERGLRSQEATSGFRRDEDDPDTWYATGTEKLDALLDIVSDLPSETPLVVFARFRPDIDRIMAALDDAGVSAGELSGKADDLVAFQSGKVDILVCQIQSGKEGIDLSRARYCVFYSLGYSLGDYLQSRRRINRPREGDDSGGKVVFYHLIANGTDDERVYEALAAREDVVRYIQQLERGYVQPGLGIE